MKIATFNINDVNKRLGNLIGWLRAEKPDVVALQELKAADREFPKAAMEKAGYGAVWHGQKTWNGVAILARGCEPIVTRRELPGDTDDRQARYIEAAVNGVIVTSLYAPNGNPQPGPKFDYKLAWMERLLAHAKELYAAGVPVVLAGDYNVVPTDHDIYAVRSYADDALLQPEPRAQFQKLLRQGWRDALRALHPDAALYTYWSYLRNRWPRDAGLRIDHLLLSALAAKRLAAAGVDREVRGEAGASDHAPAWVELKEAGGGRSSRASGSPRRGSAGRRSLARMSSGPRLAGKSTAGKTLTNRCSEDFCAIRRANKSVGPPAANPTITHGPAGQVSATAVGLQRLLSRKIAQPIVARFFPLLGEFDRGGKPSIARVLASSCQNSPHAVSRSFT